MLTATCRVRVPGNFSCLLLQVRQVFHVLSVQPAGVCIRIEKPNGLLVSIYHTLPLFVIMPFAGHEKPTMSWGCSLTRNFIVFAIKCGEIVGLA